LGASAAIAAGLLAYASVRKAARLQQRGMAAHLGHEVLVHTKDEHSVRGIVAAVYADSYALERVSVYEGTTAKPVPGGYLIYEANTSLVQRVEADKA
jgi:hypothetical protein